MMLPESLGVEGVRYVARKLSSPRPAGPELTAVVVTGLQVVPPWCRADESIMELPYGPLKVPLGGLEMFNIGIFNTGSETLLAERFQQPIQVELFKEARLVGLTVQWRRHGQIRPEDEAISISQEDSAVVIHPRLMNTGDALMLTGLVVARGTIDPRLSVRYPNLPAIEQLRLKVEAATLDFVNLEAESRKIRWPLLRKIAPKRWGYRRAGQLQDAIEILLRWQDSR